MQDEIFIFHYRPKYRPVADYVRGPDLVTVKKRCLDYCNKHGITFISVRPFFLDLERGIRDPKTLTQEGDSPSEIAAKESLERNKAFAADKELKEQKEAKSVALQSK